MGNCCKPAAESSMEWCGEDWSYLATENSGRRRRKRMSSRSKVFDEGHGLRLGTAQKEKVREALKASGPDHANGKVKIKITKKELREMLGGIEKEGRGVSSAEEVLLRLMNARDHDAQGIWRPVLETIPEVS